MRKKEIYIILHNIRSRYNVGSIFRTADGAGVNKIYLCGITPCPPHSRISKVALGAENYVPWEYTKQTWRLLKKLKNEGVYIAGVELNKKSIPYYDFKPNHPLAIVLGAETTGLPSSILNRCNALVAIPMHGQKESLNVATATGIIAYSVI